MTASVYDDLQETKHFIIESGIRLILEYHWSSMLLTGLAKYSQLSYVQEDEIKVDNLQRNTGDIEKLNACLKNAGIEILKYLKSTSVEQITINGGDVVISLAQITAGLENFDEFAANLSMSMPASDINI